MGKMNDRRILHWINEGSLKISPFVNTKVREDSEGRRIASFGLGSSGYDFRLSNQLKIFKDGQALERHLFSLKDLGKQAKLIIDPHDFNEDEMFFLPKPEPDENGRPHFLLPANTYALGVAMEHLALPSNIDCVWVGKSTHARCGLFINTTPGEPGWRGYVTLELYNAAGIPLKLYPGEGICQTLFYEYDQPCLEDYEKTRGKYQDQPQEPIAPRS